MGVRKCAQTGESSQRGERGAITVPCRREKGEVGVGLWGGGRQTRIERKGREGNRTNYKWLVNKQSGEEMWTEEKGDKERRGNEE